MTVEDRDELAQWVIDTYKRMKLAACEKEGAPVDLPPMAFNTFGGFVINTVGGRWDSPEHRHVHLTTVGGLVRADAVAVACEAYMRMQDRPPEGRPLTRAERRQRLRDESRSYNYGDLQSRFAMGDTSVVECLTICAASEPDGSDIMVMTMPFKYAGKDLVMLEDQATTTWDSEGMMVDGLLNGLALSRANPFHTPGQDPKLSSDEWDVLLQNLSEVLDCATTLWNIGDPNPLGLFN